MKKRICDKCGALIVDDDSLRGSVYQFKLSRDSVGRIDGVEYPKLKKADFCYKCACLVKKDIEKVLSSAIPAWREIR